MIANLSSHFWKIQYSFNLKLGANSSWGISYHRRVNIGRKLYFHEGGGVMLTRGPRDHYPTHLSGRHLLVSDTVPFGVRSPVQRSPPQKPISTQFFQLILRKGSLSAWAFPPVVKDGEIHFPEPALGGFETFDHIWHDSARGLPLIVTRRSFHVHGGKIFDQTFSDRLFEFVNSTSCDDDEPHGLSSSLPTRCHPPPPFPDDVCAMPLCPFYPFITARHSWHYVLWGLECPMEYAQCICYILRYWEWYRWYGMWSSESP